MKELDEKFLTGTVDFGEGSVLFKQLQYVSLKAA